MITWQSQVSVRIQSVICFPQSLKESSLRSAAQTLGRKAKISHLLKRKSQMMTISSLASLPNSKTSSLTTWIESPWLPHFAATMMKPRVILICDTSRPTIQTQWIVSKTIMMTKMMAVPPTQATIVFPPVSLSRDLQANAVIFSTRKC